MRVDWQKELIPYEQGLNEVIVKIQSLKNSYDKLGINSPIESVKGRIKSINSIVGKAHKKNLHKEEIFDKIDDIAGIRIICRFEQDIFAVAEHLKTRTDMKVIEEKDYVTNSKNSGYRSFHIIIRYEVVGPVETKPINIEIQLRTMAMDFWATIEHTLKYKYSHKIPFDIQGKLIATAEAAATLDNEMSTIRHEILEVHELKLRKETLVQNILDNLQKLYSVNQIETANAFNERFFEIFEKDDFDELLEFSYQVETATIIFKG